MLERHELEAFLELAEELHFGRAGERLHVSTSRISQTIRKLERRLGGSLFERNSRRVELSPLGRALYDEVRPAWDRITTAVAQAIEAGRGFGGLLRVCFIGAAGGQLLLGAAELFQRRHPECEVQIREAALIDLMRWLHEGEADLALATFPIHEPGIMTGPALVTEARFLAVPVSHPFASRPRVSVEDLARVTVLRLPETLPESLRSDVTPESTPAGLPIRPGPSASTFQEILTLVGAGYGVLPVGANTRRYYVRPDVAYVHVPDAPPVRWGLFWRTDSVTARVQEFSQAAYDLTHL